jgi:hypothetical protein
MTRARATFAMAAAVMVLGLGAQVARAQPSPIELAWYATDTCPDTVYVLNQAIRLAGPNGSLAYRRGVRARAIVARSPGGFRLELTTETDGSRGHRVLEAPSCRSLADATAMIIALVLNPESGARLDAGTGRIAGSGDPYSPSAPVESQSSRASQASPNPTSKGTVAGHLSRRPLGLGADVLGVAVFGRFPWTSVAIGGALSLTIGRSELALAGAYAPSQSSRDDSGVKASFGSASAGLRACYLPRLGRLSIGPCLGHEVSRVEGEASRSQAPIIRPFKQTTTWVESWIGARLLWAIGDFTVGGSADVGVPWRRQEFKVEGGTWTYQVRALLGRVSLAAGVRF